MKCESRTAGSAGVSPPHPLRPVVLGTSRIVDLAELAVAKLSLPPLRDGVTSVAIETVLSHLAHASSGELRVAAKELGPTGRLRHFSVEVFDDKGLIASATHTRAVMTQRRLSGLARRRAGLPSMQLGV